ncbi:MAG: hypothetical protein EZS28_034683 [Streblomastix strix]|uniref:Uncharacterized protein n=1 Tax=Streblomastix strix TaxID=222440 RepID=A0A5J4UIH3_9EUKA|nr:MAG: hypothetical protein EZS28_034683 [Streblomastix strix]
MKNCTTSYKKILLNIVELIAEKGIQKTYGRDLDPIFNDIQSSGLLNKIEQIIKDKIEEENEQKKYSVEAEQLIKILRSSSRRCLWSINDYGDASTHTELVNANYVRVLVIAISTASGVGEEQDWEIRNELRRISIFLSSLHQGRNSFPPQPLLAQRADEQIEEEGGNEEIDAQLINKRYSDNIKNSANEAKGMILNYFIEQGNRKPYWY